MPRTEIIADMRNKGYIPWPSDGKPANFGRDIIPPLRRAFMFAYAMKRVNQGKSIPWNGLDIGEQEKVGCHSPKTKLSASQLKYSDEEQGRSALDELIGLAVQIGIEQGRRIDRKSTIRSLYSMSAGLKLHTMVDNVVKELGLILEGKKRRKRMRRSISILSTVATDAGETLTKIQND